jgi:hypothetical protein
MSFIPKVGTFYSQSGNILFPRWEYFFRALKNTFGVILFSFGVILFSFGVLGERSHKNKKDSQRFG